MSIFGLIAHLKPDNAVVVFIGAVILLVCLEHAIEGVCEWAVEHKFGPLVQKMQIQLLMLGICSFMIFVFEFMTTSSSEIEESLASFEFTQAILLFIAMAFVIQAASLIQVCL
jgi:hypothetical protein